MNRNYFFWITLIVLASTFLTFSSIWEDEKTSVKPLQEGFNTHPIAPFPSYISGVGVVEASSDNISIGTPINRIVDQVFVHVGMEVKKGDVLFKLENDDLKSDLVMRQLAYEIALAKIERLKALPRQEEVMAAEATLKNAQVELNQAWDQYQMVEGLQDSRALSRQEINRRRFNYEQAEAHWQEAKANLSKVQAGTWQPDIDIAYLLSQQAKANVDKIQTDIERTIIRSPINGKVLQVKIHEGEFPAVISLKGPLMIVGNIDEIYLKVSINQFDAPYFRSDAPAIAFLRGNARMEFPLEFVRLEPYLVNKQNLTNEITEKVDTRVLQVIYRITKKQQNIFVGQQMDVFIEAEFPS